MTSETESDSEELWCPLETGKIAEDPKKTAVTYLEKHGIKRLFEKLLAEITLYRPEDPIQYMIDQVENISQKIDY